MMPFKIIEVERTASTQSLILEMDREGTMREYTVVVTTDQTSGRGQGKNVWESERGKNLLFSMVLEPICTEASDQFLITQFISLAIVDTLKEYAVEEVRIKWPNDIYIGEKKVCGVLIQNNVIGNQISKTYIGIGINVNQEKFVLAPNPTSIALEKGREYDLREVLESVLERVLVRYKMLKEGKREEIKREYLDLLLYRGEKRKYVYKDKEIEAKIENVNCFGHLILETERGGKIVCELKELRFVIGK